jgi:hypothetical protein
MKKILCLCAAFALFAAVGCDDKKTSPPAGGAKGTPTPTPAAGDKPAPK